MVYTHTEEDTLKLLEYNSIYQQAEKARYQQASYNTYAGRRFFAFQFVGYKLTLPSTFITCWSLGMRLGAFYSDSTPLVRKEVLVPSIRIDFYFEGKASIQRSTHSLTHQLGYDRVAGCHLITSQCHDNLLSLYHESSSFFFIMSLHSSCICCILYPPQYTLLYVHSLHTFLDTTHSPALFSTITKCNSVYSSTWHWQFIWAIVLSIL